MFKHNRLVKRKAALVRVNEAEPIKFENTTFANNDAGPCGGVLQGHYAYVEVRSRHADC